MGRSSVRLKPRAGSGPIPAMSAASAAPDPAVPESDEDRIERHLRMLRRMAEIGMDLLETVREQAQAEPPPDPVALGNAFARISRAVRQTMVLEAKIAEERRTRAAEAPRPTNYNPMLEAVERHRKEDRMAKVRARVAKAIQREAEANEVEDLAADLLERLDDDDIDAMLLTRPAGEIVARICKDLGLERPWRVWDGENQAAEDVEETDDGPAADSPPIPEPTIRPAQPEFASGSDPP